MKTLRAILEVEDDCDAPTLRELFRARRKKFERRFLIFADERKKWRCERHDR